jgi:hypothetical protein
VNERLAKHYGIPSRASAFRRVALDGEQRAGIFTQASVLTVTCTRRARRPCAAASGCSEQVLGASVPPPPGAGDPDHPDDRKAATLRQRMERHLKDPELRSVPSHLDPLGFGLEAYDAGRGARGTARSLDTSARSPTGARSRRPRSCARSCAPTRFSCAASPRSCSRTRSLGRGLTSDARRRPHRVGRVRGRLALLPVRRRRGGQRPVPQGTRRGGFPMSAPQQAP